MINISVTLNFDIPDWDVEALIESAGYGIGYWASEILDNGDHTVTVVYKEDPDDFESTSKAVNLSYGALVRALATIAENDELDVAVYARRYFMEGDSGHIDSELADAMVQTAIFGSVTYG